MHAVRRLALASALLAGPVLGLGCRTVNQKSPWHGSLSCSCSTVGCTCPHCTGEATDCKCRGDDVFGGGTAVGEPGDSH